MAGTDGEWQVLASAQAFAARAVDRSETFESLSESESLEPKLRDDSGRQAAVDEAESHT